MSEKDRKISDSTERSAGEYLFGSKDMSSDQIMDFRTRIKKSDMMNTIFYYALIGENLGSKVAYMIKNCIERLLVSHEGEGRKEAVEILRQQFPKMREIQLGWESPRKDDSIS